MTMKREPKGGRFLVETTDPGEVFVPEDFNSEDKLIGKTAEDFLRDEVMPKVERIEAADHTLMHDLMRKAGELGLLAADVPEVYGGLALKQTTAALIAEKLNPQQSFALTHEAHTVIATLPLLYFGNDDQKRRYLPLLATGEWIGSFALSEANSGSDALAMQTRATLSPDGSHYILNGVKSWITNSAFAKLFTVFGKIAETDGEKISVFLVERDFSGVSFGKEEHKLGMHGTSTRRVILEDVRVPIANVLAVGKGHYAAFCALNLGRFKLEAGAVGGLKATLAQCTTYALQRSTFGRPIAEYGLIQHKLAEMTARTFALESMVYRLAGDLDSVFEPIIGDAADASVHYHRAAEEFALECNIVKVIGSETYSQWTDEAIQIHGGYGYTEEFPVARAWRDQRLLRIGEGANEIVRLAIINLMLRRDKQGRLPVLETGRRAAAELASYWDGVRETGAIQLEDIESAANLTKHLALILLLTAQEKLGSELMEMQEIPASVADIVCSAYAIESVWLRCKRIHEVTPTRYDTALSAARVAAVDYGTEAAWAAHYVLDSLELTGSTEQTIVGVQELIERVSFKGVNAMRLRRNLAQLALAKEGYPL